MIAFLCCRYLLPPIIFYAGISVKKKQFFRNFASIATFGVLGTYIAFAVIAIVLYGFSKLPNVLNFSVSHSWNLSHFVEWTPTNAFATTVTYMQAYILQVAKLQAAMRCIKVISVMICLHLWPQL